MRRTWPRLEPERLAELLLDVTAGDAAGKRRLRIELASRSGGDVAGAIRKRLVLRRQIALVH